MAREQGARFAVQGTRLTVHAARDLTRLLVAPADGREVGLVVHEAAVEERLDVRVRRRDVDLRTFHQSQSPLMSKLAHLSTGSRVLQVLEHRDVLAGRQERVVGVRARDDRAEHDGLVGLVLEILVPERVELGAHLLELLLGRADLEPSVDSVRGEACLLRARLPLCEELLLGVLVSAEEVVERHSVVGDAVD